MRYMYLLIIPVIVILIITIIIMNTSINSMQENNNLSTGSGRASARDFFLHLGSMVALYATAISFLNLVFRIINKALPEVNQNVYAWGGGSEISLPVATLVVAFP